MVGHWRLWPSQPHDHSMGLILCVSLIILNYFTSKLFCRYSIPVRSIFECLDGGCEVVAMSTDAKYIAVITTGSPQVSHCDKYYDHFGCSNWAD